MTAKPADDEQIAEHPANTAWLGRRVGLIVDAAFFEAPAEERARRLAPFSVVEFKHPLTSAPAARMLHDAGFAWIDVQIEFRIALGRVDDSPSLGALDVRFADEGPFTVKEGSTRPFESERFAEIPGMTQDALDRRYTAWARQMIAEHPELCLAVSQQGRPQGWFLSRPGKRGLNLALAMLHRDATVSGLLLYQAALRAYAARGHAMGWAGFSARNVGVHNIYARLGAHFTAPVGCWLWIHPEMHGA